MPWCRSTLRESCLQISFCAPPLQPSNRWKWSARQNENLFRKGCLQTPQIMSEGSSPKARVRRLESEAQDVARRTMAESGARSRWANSPKTAAKQQVKECWEMWNRYPGRYRSKKEFAFDMLSKYPELENSETIQRWCRTWQEEVASSVSTMPARS